MLFQRLSKFQAVFWSFLVYFSRFLFFKINKETKSIKTYHCNSNPIKASIELAEDVEKKLTRDLFDRIFFT